MSAPALAVLTPDGGGRVVSGPSNMPALAELLQWLPVADHRQPDDEMTVLAAWEDGTVEGCFKLGDAWHYCYNGAECTTPPTWWAEWPAGPRC